MRALFIALLTFSLVFPGPLWGQAGTRRVSSSSLRVAVVDLWLERETSTPTPWMVSQLVSAFQLHRQVRVASPEDVNAWLKRQERIRGGDEPNEELAEARGLLAKGKKLYEDLDFDGAVDQLHEAQKLYILNLPFLRSNRDLIDTHLYLGMTYLAQKKSKEAKDQFRRVSYLDPKREPSGKDFPPPMLKSFAETKQEVLAAETSRVALTSEPVGAAVFLNGRPLGKTPLTLDLLKGEYFLLMELEGRQPWYRPVKIQKRMEQVRVSLKLDEYTERWRRLFRVREGSDVRAADIGPILDLAGEVSADFVFLGTLEQKKDFRLLGQLLDARTSELSQVAMVNVGADLSDFGGSAAALSETLIGFVRGDGFLVNSEKPNLNLPLADRTVGGADRPPQPILEATPPGKKWYEKWWIWGLVAGVGVGVYFGARELGGTGGTTAVVNNRGNF